MRIAQGFVAALLMTATGAAAAPIELNILVDPLGLLPGRSTVLSSTDPFAKISDAGGGASANASVDLPSGTIRVSARSSVTEDAVSAASATATVADIITIEGPVSEPTIIPVKIEVDGTLISGINSSSPTSVTSELAIFLYANSSLGGSTTSILFADRGYDCGTANYTYCYIGQQNYDVSFVVPIQISPLAMNFSIGASVTANAQYGGESLFGNTAYLSFVLPAGLTFTSQSGYFLTAQTPDPTTVPEPASFALLGAGLFGLAAAQRGRARNRTTAAA